VASRSLTVSGEVWRVYPSGRVSSYDRDEFALVFELGTGPGRIRRVTQFSPIGARQWDAALLALSDRELESLFHHSQPARTSPHVRYDRPQ
jgi:hypothetical protein